MDPDEDEYPIDIYLPNGSEDYRDSLRQKFKALENISANTSSRTVYSFFVDDPSTLSSRSDDVNLIFYVPRQDNVQQARDYMYTFVKAAIQSWNKWFYVQRSSFSDQGGNIYLAQMTAYTLYVQLQNGNDRSRFELNLDTETMQSTSSYRYEVAERMAYDDNYDNFLEIIFEIPPDDLTEENLEQTTNRIRDFVFTAATLTGINFSQYLSTGTMEATGGQITLEASPEAPSTPTGQGISSSGPTGPARVRPARRTETRRRRRTRINLDELIRRENTAQLGVEYTLEEFREKEFPDEKLIFKRFRYDYDTKKWVSTKMVLKDDGKSQEMLEVDCNIVPMYGDEWGLKMPVKTKVQKPTGEKVWDKQMNGELYLYCAEDLRKWLRQNKSYGYGIYVEDEGAEYTQNEKNDRVPYGAQLKIVAVQYLSKEERDTLQEEYKRNAQERKSKKEERKRERGDEDEAIEKRRRTAEENMRKALSKSKEQIIELKKKQLSAAEKEIWETEAQDTSSFNSNEWETYNTILAGARKRITEFKKDLKRLGETAWVEEWQKETNRRKKEWRISFLKDKLSKAEREIFDAESSDPSFSEEKIDAVLTGSEKRLEDLLNELKGLGETAWVEEWDKREQHQKRFNEWRIDVLKDKVMEEEKKIMTKAFNDTLFKYLLQELKELGEEAWVDEWKKSKFTRYEEYVEELTLNNTDEDDDDSDYDPEGLFQSRSSADGSSSSSSSLISRTRRVVMLKF